MLFVIKMPYSFEEEVKSIIFNGQFVKYIELPPDFKVGVLLLANRRIKDLYVCKSGHIFAALSYNLPIQKVGRRKEGKYVRTDI